MKTFRALLTNARNQDHFTKAVAMLEKGKADGSIYNVDFQWAKSAVNNALSEARGRFFDLHGCNWTHGSPENEFYYWYSQMHTVPGQIKRLNKHRDRPLIVAALVWLEEIAPIAKLLVDLKPMIVKGRKPSETPVVIDLENAGTCAICGNLHKMAKNAHKMVLHGYTRPGDGYTYGNCFGYQFPPYELSNAANIEFASYIDDLIKKNAESLADLNAGKVKKFVKEKRTYGGYLRADKIEFVTLTPEETPEAFAIELRDQIFEHERNDRWLNKDKSRNLRKIAEWKLQPLPAEAASAAAKKS